MVEIATEWKTISRFGEWLCLMLWLTLSPSEIFTPCGCCPLQSCSTATLQVHRNREPLQSRRAVGTAGRRTPKQLRLRGGGRLTDCRAAFY